MRVGNLGILVTVAEASQLLKTPVGTLRRWAHEDGWDRHGGQRSRHWKLDQVQAGHDRRAESAGVTHHRAGGGDALSTRQDPPDKSWLEVETNTGRPLPRPYPKEPG